MMTASISIVMPALNAEARLAHSVASLEEGRKRDLVGEIIVVDGGSNDRTAEIARQLGTIVLASERGRGHQMAFGAEAAKGRWLLFLHADTSLEPGWSDAVAAFVQRADAARCAAVFTYALDDPDPRARRIERWARWRDRRLGLPYGDQGLLIARGLYRELGGFRPMVLMEDVDMVRRLTSARLERLDARAFTGAGRYHAGGWWLRPTRNLCLLGLYFMGLPPRILGRLYE